MLAQLLHGLWDLPGPGIEPVSPALQDRFLTTEPPGKPHFELFLVFRYYFNSKKKAQKQSGRHFGTLGMTFMFGSGEGTLLMVSFPD